MTDTPSTINNVRHAKIMTESAFPVTINIVIYYYGAINAFNTIIYTLGGSIHIIIYIPSEIIKKCFSYL